MRKALGELWVSKTQPVFLRMRVAFIHQDFCAYSRSPNTQAAAAAGAAAFIVLSWSGSEFMRDSVQSNRGGTNSKGGVPIPGMLLGGRQGLQLLQEMHVAAKGSSPPLEVTLALDPGAPY